MPNSISKSDVIQEILEAFHGVSCPKTLTLHRAQAHDDFNSDDTSLSQVKEHRGSWEQIPEVHLLNCQQALPHLDKEGMRYYLPAFMIWVLNHFSNKKDEWIIDATIYALGTYSSGAQGEYKKKQFELFDAKQLKACVRFLNYLLQEDPHGEYVDAHHIRKALERRWRD